MHHWRRSRGSTQPATTTPGCYRSPEHQRPARVPLPSQPRPPRVPISSIQHSARGGASPRRQKAANRKPKEQRNIERGHQSWTAFLPRWWGWDRQCRTYEWLLEVFRAECPGAVEGCGNGCRGRGRGLRRRLVLVAEVYPTRGKQELYPKVGERCTMLQSVDRQNTAPASWLPPRIVDRHFMPDGRSKGNC